MKKILLLIILFFFSCSLIAQDRGHLVIIGGGDKPDYVLQKIINFAGGIDAKIIVMGDFNDGPKSNSIKTLVNNNDLFNPMLNLHAFDRGTTNYDFAWDLFDQILFSTNLFKKKDDGITYVNTNIFDADFLKQFHGKYKGQPFRTYVGKKYQGGYSDHFPVYMIIKKPANL